MLLTLYLQLFIIFNPPNAYYICICFHFHLAFHDFYNTQYILIFVFFKDNDKKLNNKSNEIERVNKIPRGSQSIKLHWNSKRGGGGGGCKSNKCDHPGEIWVFSGTTNCKIPCSTSMYTVIIGFYSFRSNYNMNNIFFQLWTDHFAERLIRKNCVT